MTEKLYFMYFICPGHLYFSKIMDILAWSYLFTLGQLKSAQVLKSVRYLPPQRKHKYFP